MQIDVEQLLDRLAQKARPLALAACGMAVLAGMHAVRLILADRAARAEASVQELGDRSYEVSEALADAESRQREVSAQLGLLKRGLPKLAESKRKTYEGGLQLQEEKRLLEKQLELVSTYLLIDEAAHQVHVMRGEQALETYAAGADAPRAFGGAKPPPALTAVISKERYAHPERPKPAENVDGTLQWEPPQVATSLRVNALGEFVVFTRGPLILHGPPKSVPEHESFPHVCLEVTLPVARRLYAAANVGTKVMLKRAPSEVAKKK